MVVKAFPDIMRYAMKKKIKKILVFTIISAVFCMILNLFLGYLLTHNCYIPRKISIETVNKIEYKPDDTLFLKEESNNASFWVTTIDGDKELFNIKYTGLTETVKYRKYDNYIYFWLNGNAYKSAEIYDNKPIKELRAKTDAKAFITL